MTEIRAILLLFEHTDKKKRKTFRIEHGRTTERLQMRLGGIEILVNRSCHREWKKTCGGDILSYRMTDRIATK